jgi:8-oxo-dGTP pyrophosphatase MutT (NUDIX family)
MKKIVFSSISMGFCLAMCLLSAFTQVECFAVEESAPTRKLATRKSAYACIYATEGVGIERIFYTLVARKNTSWPTTGRGISSNPGQTIFPGGGIKSGQTSRQAAAGEFEEETGLKLPDGLSEVKEFDYVSTEIIEDSRRGRRFGRFIANDYSSLYVRVAKEALDKLA